MAKKEKTKSIFAKSNWSRWKKSELEMKNLSEEKKKNIKNHIQSEKLQIFRFSFWCQNKTTQMKRAQRHNFHNWLDNITKIIRLIFCSMKPAYKLFIWELILMNVSCAIMLVFVLAIDNKNNTIHFNMFYCITNCQFIQILYALGARAHKKFCISKLWSLSMQCFSLSHSYLSLPIENAK